MSPLFVTGISALVGAAVLGSVAETGFALALLMGAILGATIAIAAYAFPHDLDYRERRARPRS